MKCGGDLADPRCVRALEYHGKGAIDAATQLYEAVLEDRPRDVDALHLLGVARRAQGRLHEAERLIRAALACRPDFSDAWYNLGNVLLDLARADGAVDAFSRAVASRPELASARYGLGLGHARAGNLEAAIEAYRQVLVLEPHHVAARHNLANLLAEAGDDLAAAAELRRVLTIAPELAEGHYNLARVLLRLGDYGTGFAEYHWRWHVEGFPDRPRRPELPLWDGGPVRGLTVLAQAEQGLGDTIQTVRLLPLLASLGCTVTLEVPASLVRLLEGVAGADRIVSCDAPATDAHLRIPLFDLPAKLRLTLGSIPAAVPYLRADPRRAALWRERLDASDGRYRIGICWRGNPNSPVDPGRSLSGPEELASALARPEVRLIALCLPEVHPVEPSKEGLGWRLAGLPVEVEHPGPTLDAPPDAFVDTAAILQSLDLVVTTDTAVAHLAGALARPTLLLLPAVADWRWLRDRADSPWYPTFRLLRQPRRGDWTTVLREARQEVERRIAGRSR